MYKYIILLICLLYPIPVYAMTIGELMKKTVAPGSPGFVILEIIGIAIASWVGEMICNILGKQNLAGFIKILTAFAGTLIVLLTGTNIINKMLALF